MIDNPKDVWEKQLDEMFSHKERTSEEKFLNVLSIILYENNKNTDLADLFSTVDFNSFIKVVDLFDGRTISFPTKEEIKDAVELALFFYYKEILGITSYDSLKKLNIREDKDFSSISIGRKINNLKKEIKEEIIDSLKDINNGQS